MNNNKTNKHFEGYFLFNGSKSTRVLLKKYKMRKNQENTNKAAYKKRWKTLNALECKLSTVTSNPGVARTKRERVTKITIK